MRKVPLEVYVLYWRYLQSGLPMQLQPLHTEAQSESKLGFFILFSADLVFPCLGSHVYFHLLKNIFSFCPVGCIML